MATKKAEITENTETKKTTRTRKSIPKLSERMLTTDDLFPVRQGSGTVAWGIKPSVLMRAFDESIGENNWQIKYDEGACGIGIRRDEEFVWKWGYGETVAESITIAAAMWGLGRDILAAVEKTIPGVFVSRDEDGSILEVGFDFPLPFQEFDDETGFIEIVEDVEEPTTEKLTEEVAAEDKSLHEMAANINPKTKNLDEALANELIEEIIWKVDITGTELGKMLGHYGVQYIDDLTEEQAMDAIAKLDIKRAKMEG